MLAVLKCKCDSKLYAAQSGYQSHELVDSAKDLGMVSQQEPFDVSAKVEEVHGQAFRERVWQKIKLKQDQEIIGETNSYNSIGSCAAPNAIILCLDDNGYPKEMTERWYSTDGTPTGKPYKYKKMMKKTKKPVTQKSRVFKSGESVPPCGTCEILLPILMCPGEGEDLCSHQKQN